ncbi:MAG: histidine phosphatase family protein, partial [Chloroflexota bacterium]
IYSSDLARCRDSAAAIAAVHARPVTADADLREIGFGECEGLSFAEIDARFPGAERFWAPGASDVCFPGGESVNLLAARVGRFLARATAAHAGKESVLVVSHGGPLKVMLCRALGLPVDRWWQFRLDLASISLLDLYPEGALVSRLNDTCHLDNMA